MDGISHRDGPADVNREQTDSTGHVHNTATEAPDLAGNEGGHDKRPARVDKVDVVLGGRVGEANHLQEIAHVVTDEGVATPLGEETQHGSDEGTTAHTAGTEKISPGLLGRLVLDLEGLTNLDDFGLEHSMLVEVIPPPEALSLDPVDIP
jgi:hypothetical protein